MVKNSNAFKKNKQKYALLDDSSNEETNASSLQDFNKKNNRISEEDKLDWLR